MDFDGVAKAGSMLGSAGTIVMDDSTCMVWMAKNLSYFYKHESCGKCSPCREGTGWMLRLLTRIEAGEGTQADIDMLFKVVDSIGGKTVCPFGDGAITRRSRRSRSSAPSSTTTCARSAAGGRSRRRSSRRSRRAARRWAREPGPDASGVEPGAAGADPRGREGRLIIPALQGVFSLMTWIERRVLAFMQFRLGPTAPGPSGCCSRSRTASSSSSRKS
jgi:hypothetical protein